jgi:hypothetical protein
MKKFYIFTLLLGILITMRVAAQDSIPNKSFEEWTNYGAYENPDFWDTPNEFTGLVSLYTVTKDSIGVYDGQYAARLETKHVVIMNVPGLITLGTISVNIATQQFSITGGVGFTARPVKMTGYYKYTPQTGDACSFAIALTKFNTGTNHPDTIGAGLFVQSSPVSDWTLFEVPVIYFSQETPDTMNIVITSSPIVGAIEGSVLLVDTLDLDLGVGMDEITKDENVNLFYDQALRLLMLDFNYPVTEQVSVKIYNLTGQVMFRMQENLTSGRKNINLGDFPKGLYMVEVTAGDERTVRKVIR